MPPYHHRDSNHKGKMVWRSYHLYSGNPYTREGGLYIETLPWVISQDFCHKDGKFVFQSMPWCSKSVPWGIDHDPLASKVPKKPCITPIHQSTQRVSSYRAQGRKHPGPRFTNGFSIAIRIRWKISFHSHLDSNTVIATKFCIWHDSCRGMCNNLLPSDGQQRNCG